MIPTLCPRLAHLFWRTASLAVFSALALACGSEGTPTGPTGFQSQTQDSAVTDRNGHYEFRSPYPSVPAWLRPPDGYERKPIDPTASFPLVPGQNMTVRRIAGVTISPPATVTEGAGRTSVNARVWFDTGQTEVPYADAFVMTSSDTTILRTGSGGGLGAPYIEGLKPGTASVTGRYFGVPSSTFQVQVQAR